jgi:archaemetzincin
MINLVPFEQIPQNFIEELKIRLEEVFATTVVVSSPLSIPKGAYEPHRDQYNANPFLHALERGDIDEQIVGIVDKDLFIPQLNFIFGIADPEGRRALIAISRLRQEFYGLTANCTLFLLRALKEAVHELGHTSGLGHCLDPQCVMYFSNSLIDTDRKEYQFCHRCRNKFIR